MREKLKELSGIEGDRLPHGALIEIMQYLEKRNLSYTKSTVSKVIKGDYWNDEVMEAAIAVLGKHRRRQYHIENKRSMILKQIDELIKDIKEKEEFVIIRRIEYEALMIAAGKNQKTA